MSFLNLLLATLPGLLICYLIFLFDKKEKEKVLPLLICFLLGILITFPALQLESWADRKGIVESPNVGLTLLLAFVVVALNEELFKYLCLLAYPYQKDFFNEPLDGIIYSVMIGMGFATFENILYAVQFSSDTMAIRAFTAVPAHAAFGVIAGYFAGRAKFDPKNQYRLLGFGLLSAVGLHGLYDFFILQQNYEWLISLSTLTLAISLYLAYRLLMAHQESVHVLSADAPAVKTPPALPEDEIMDAILEDLADEEE